MNLYLVKRHCTIFFRDKSAVFFAVLAGLIAIGINLFLLSGVYAKYFTAVGFPNEQAMIFVTAWTVCGALAINAVTVPLSFVGFAVADKEHEVIKDFKSSSISSSTLNFSYVVSSVLVTLIINIPTMIGLVIYLFSKEALSIQWIDFMLFLGTYTLGIILFSMIGMVLIKFIKTQSAHSGLVGVSSAFLGFLGAIYMPIGNFSGLMKTIITINPLTMLGMVIKQTFMSGFIQEMKLPQELLAYFGITLKAFDFDFNCYFVIVVLLGSCLILFFLNNLIQEKE